MISAHHVQRLEMREEGDIWRAQLLVYSDVLVESLGHDLMVCACKRSWWSLSCASILLPQPPAHHATSGSARWRCNLASLVCATSAAWPAVRMFQQEPYAAFKAIQERL